jgi:hypothetical protein
MASIEVSGMAVKGQGCHRPVFTGASGAVGCGIAPGIYSVFPGGAVLAGRMPALL